MILIIGCGRLGGSLAARLAAAGRDVTVLDHALTEQVEG